MTTPTSRPLRVAVIGAGPAGIYAADMLTKTEAVREGELEVSVDLFDRYPTPFGLIRYGVAPDHPRIKGIITALRSILGRGDIRFFGNVEYGRVPSTTPRWTFPARTWTAPTARPASWPGTTATRTTRARGRWRPRRSR